MRVRYIVRRNPPIVKCWQKARQRDAYADRPAGFLTRNPDALGIWVSIWMSLYLLAAKMFEKEVEAADWHDCA